MATVLGERLDTGQSERDETTATRVRSFFVTGTSVIDAEMAPGLPQFGEQHPEDLSLFVARRSARPINGHSDLFEFDAEYRGFQGSGEQPVPQDKVGLVSVSASATAVFDDAWRTMPGLIYPSDGNVSNANTTDIAGVKADISAEPVSFLRRQVSLIVAENVVSSKLDVAIMFNFVARRNSVLFFDFAAGTVVYIGPRIVREYSSTVVKVEHEFLVDEFRHLRQYPSRNASGVISLDSATGVKHAEAVYWRQPYPLTADLNLISKEF